MSYIKALLSDVFEAGPRNWPEDPAAYEPAPEDLEPRPLTAPTSFAPALDAEVLDLDAAYLHRPEPPLPFEFAHGGAITN